MNNISSSMKLEKIVTAGSSYLDIDAYACMVALVELLRQKGETAIAYSQAKCNYSVCDFLMEEDQIESELPSGFDMDHVKYIIVDVSDPEFLSDSVPLHFVEAVYDHHIGFEEYWTSRIGDKTHIEFIGAAATLIYREWVKAGLTDKMTRNTALLLIAAILDNTLYLSSSNTTDEDRDAYDALCRHANIDEQWCAFYFEQVQENVEADLKNALFSDIKKVKDNECLPPSVAQICVWDTRKLLQKLPLIRKCFSSEEKWMLNIIDINGQCSYFICDDIMYQKKMEELFGVQFKMGIAKTIIPYLRKELIKKTISLKEKRGEEL